MTRIILRLSSFMVFFVPVKTLAGTSHLSGLPENNPYLLGFVLPLLVVTLFGIFYYCDRAAHRVEDSASEAGADLSLRTNS